MALVPESSECRAGPPHLRSGRRHGRRMSFRSAQASGARLEDRGGCGPRGPICHHRGWSQRSEATGASGGPARPPSPPPSGRFGSAEAPTPRGQAEPRRYRPLVSVRAMTSAHRVGDAHVAQGAVAVARDAAGAIAGPDRTVAACEKGGDARAVREMFLQRGDVLEGDAVEAGTSADRSVPPSPGMATLEPLTPSVQRWGWEHRRILIVRAVRIPACIGQGSCGDGIKAPMLGRRRLSRHLGASSSGSHVRLVDFARRHRRPDQN